jgi:hypothetical protein
MRATCELAARTQLRAVRAGDHVLIIAEGDLPTPGYQVDIVQDPRRIFPAQYDLLRCRLPGVFPTVITPYRYAETVRHPADHATITVHHADGSDVVDIEECGAELAPYADVMHGTEDTTCPDDADRATGFSRNLSFDEAFADAVAQLPPLDVQGVDILSRVRVIEVGGLFGGIAGFHDLFVSVCRTHDGPQ